MGYVTLVSIGVTFYVAGENSYDFYSSRSEAHGDR